MDDEVVVRANARLGTVLRGKYRLDRVLGVGGMATVYAATHRNGKEFAVKVLHADLSLRNDMRTRFLREGYLANRVNHPGAVNVLDDDVAEDGGAFLVMELLRGESVEALWERLHEKLPTALVAGIGLQLLDVLAAAHAHLLIHRDIKPANLMLTHEGQVKVLDFGIARLRDAAAVRATQTGTSLGTPAFMAPEHAMAKGDEIDAQTDVWAVGATLFTLASGELVHDAENAQQILILSATRHAPKLASVLPDVPPALAAVIDRALAFDKAERWSSAGAMRDALAAAASEVLGSVPTAARMSELLDELGADEATAERSIAPPVPHESTTSPVASKRGAPAIAVSQALPRSVASVPRPSAPGVGFITDEAVSTEPKIVVRLPRSRRTLAAAAFGAVVVVVGITVALVKPTGPRDDAGTARSATQPAIDTAPSAPPAPPSPAQVWQPAADTQPTVTLAPGPTPVVPVAATAAAPPATTHARPASQASASPAVAPSPGHSGCSPPYEFDAKGNKRWKRECL